MARSARRSRRSRRGAAPLLPLPLAVPPPSYDAMRDRALRLSAVNLLQTSGLAEESIRRDAAVAARRMRRMFGAVAVSKRAAPRAKRRRAIPDFFTLHSLRMLHPKRVMFCVRRKIRRSVLFAFNRAGFSGSTRVRYRRNASSAYSC